MSRCVWCYCLQMSSWHIQPHDPNVTACGSKDTDRDFCNMKEATRMTHTMPTCAVGLCYSFSFQPHYPASKDFPVHTHRLLPSPQPPPPYVHVYECYNFNLMLKMTVITNEQLSGWGANPTHCDSGTQSYHLDVCIVLPFMPSNSLWICLCVRVYTRLYTEEVESCITALSVFCSFGIHMGSMNQSFKKQCCAGQLWILSVAVFGVRWLQTV